MLSRRRVLIPGQNPAAGLARVELRDRTGLPVPGFELRNCRPIVTNDVACEVSWTNGADLGSLAPGPVSLRFELNNAHLYAFQFVPEPR